MQAFCTSQPHRAIVPSNSTVFLLHSPQHSVPIVCNGTSLPPSILPYSWGIWTPSNTWFFGPTQVNSPIRHLDPFSRFAGPPNMDSPVAIDRLRQYVPPVHRHASGISEFTPCSKKQPLCFLVITSANEHRFSQFFTIRFRWKFSIDLLYRLPPHLRCVATLPCEI